MNPVWEIVMLLLTSKEWTSASLANHLNVSTRTIRNYLMKIEEILPEYELSLKRQRGVGLSIEGPDEQIAKLMVDSKKYDEITNSDAKTRQMYITLELLVSNKKFYPSYFMNNYFISKSTLDNDLYQIKTDLKKEHIEIAKDHNSEIHTHGSEDAVRRVISSTLRTLESQESQFVKKNLLEVLSGLTDIDVNRIKQSVDKLLKRNDLGYSFGEIDNLIIHIVVMLVRINKGEVVSIDDDSQISEVTATAEFSASRSILKLVSEITGIQIPRNETIYLALHLISLEIANASHGGIESGKDTKLLQTAQAITTDFITMAEKVLSVDLQTDKELQAALVQHMITVITRLKYKIHVENPLRREIQEEYTMLFSITGLINPIIKKYLNVILDEDEIGLITLHLATAINRIERSIQVVVVCQSGVGISHLIASKLINRFPQIHFIHTASLPEEDNLRNIDLIISTERIKENDFSLPIITINPLVSEADVQKIQLFLDHFNKKSIKNVIRPELITISPEVKTRYEILSDISGRLNRLGYVRTDFYESVLKREEASSTEIGKGVVLTHGFPEFVLKSGVFIYISQEPIFWETEFVNIVVLFATTKEDIRDGALDLGWMYKLLDDNEFLSTLSEQQNNENVINLLLSKQ